MTSTMNNNRVCHFKLVLLGDTAVGKSCLVVRFVRDEFFEFQEPTIGGKRCSSSMSLSSIDSFFSAVFFSSSPVPVYFYVNPLHCIATPSTCGSFENPRQLDLQDLSRDLTEKHHVANTPPWNFPKPHF